MPKGIREPLQELEGGKGFGGMGGTGGGGRGNRGDGLTKEDIKGLALALGPVGAIGPAAVATGMAEKHLREKAQKEKEEREAAAEFKRESRGMKAGGSASARADGCAIRGKTRGRMV